MSLLGNREGGERYFSPPSYFRTRVFKDEMAELQRRFISRVPHERYKPWLRAVDSWRTVQDRIGFAVQQTWNNLNVGRGYVRQTQNAEH